MSTEFLSSETGELLITIAGVVASAAFAALTGSKLYNDRTTRIQRIIINAVANGVAHTYSNYVRPLKQKADGGTRKLTIREKSQAEEAAVGFAVKQAKEQGVILPPEKRQEIRAEVVKEVARVKAAARPAVRTSPSTKGG